MSSAKQRRNVIGVLSTYMGVGAECFEKHSISVLVDMTNLLVALTPPPSIYRHVAQKVQFDALEHLMNTIYQELDLPSTANAFELICAAFGNDVFAVIEGHFAASGTDGISDITSDLKSTH